MSSSPPTEPAAERPLWSPAGWSLRARLVAAMIALLALACLAVVVTTEVALHRLLYTQIDERLAEASRRFLGAPSISRPGAPPRFDQRQVQEPGTMVVEIAGGVVLKALWFSGVGDPEIDLPASVDDVMLRVPANGTPQTRELGEFGDYRLLAVQRGRRTLITGLPLRDTQATVTWVAGVLGVVTVLALVIAGWLAAVIVRRNLRPLDRMAATAGRVAELRLDRGEVALVERVPQADTDPRTEVGQVGAALNRMLEHISGALEARHASETQVRQFVADASHELRTPLAAIRGYAELTRRSPDAVPPDVAHVLRRVESEAQRMTTLVEDMLLLARLDAGRPLAQERVDLAPLVIDALSDAHAAGPDHHWRPDLPDEPVTVVGDPARLHQVLANLLSNARTHTAPGTTVTAGVRADGTHAVLRVADDGPGVPPQLLPHIFERFARGDTSRSRAAGSTGLGLAIVYAVTTAHGGTVTVDSAPGRTVFTVRLPLAGTEIGGPVEPPAGGGYPDRRDPMVFTVYEAGRAAGDSAMKP